MRAYVFPGQGAQFTGMGKDLYNSSAVAKEMFDKANKILGFDITQIMFEGTDEELKQTKITQPAVFLYSVILAKANNIQPEMVAGHSLGELSAIVASGALSFEDGLMLVSKRAIAMQKACEANPSAMAAILNLDDKIIEDICAKIDSLVVPANYNCPGQLVISGTNEGIDKAIVAMQEAGAKRALKLAVGGAFHSPLMEPAKAELTEAINGVTFNNPTCPVYQNLDAKPATTGAEIKSKLIAQMVSPVRWTQTVENMIANGATSFVECGPGKVLQGLIKKVNKDIEAISL